ncbi:MAG: hypothetical protein HQL76_08260, partial [Magnetococcales bacterium]|nr:hypothetical protein [Magnetococcales bacterium]
EEPFQDFKIGLTAQQAFQGPVEADQLSLFHSYWSSVLKSNLDFSENFRQGTTNPGLSRISALQSTEIGQVWFPLRPKSGRIDQSEGTTSRNITFVFLRKTREEGQTKARACARFPQKPRGNLASGERARGKTKSKPCGQFPRPLFSFNSPEREYLGADKHALVGPGKLRNEDWTGMMVLIAVCFWSR